MSQGQNEQQEGWNGLTAITATDVAERPRIVIPGEAFSPSQVCKGGKTRKSSDTTSFSMDNYSVEHIIVIPCMPFREERTISVRPKSLGVEEQTVYPELSCYTDGASRGNPGPSACAYILVTGTGTVIEEQGRSLGHGTNNEAEYRGLIAGLSAAARYGCRNLVLFSDSELIVRQMQGYYRVTSPRLRPLYDQARALLSCFTKVTFHAVPRENPFIVRADQLCNQALGAGS